MDKIFSGQNDQGSITGFLGKLKIVFVHTWNDARQQLSTMPFLHPDKLPMLLITTAYASHILTILTVREACSLHKA